MNLARGLRVLLAVALLVAWQNALVHPIEHVDEAGGFVHLSGGHDGEQRNGNTPAPLCDAIAAVAACVNSGSGLDFASLQGGESPACGIAVVVPGSPLLAYRSQAPPQYS